MKKVIAHLQKYIRARHVISVFLKIPEYVRLFIRGNLHFHNLISVRHHAIFVMYDLFGLCQSYSLQCQSHCQLSAPVHFHQVSMQETIKQCSWVTEIWSNVIYFNQVQDNVFVLWYYLVLSFDFTETGPTQSHGARPANMSTTGDPLEVNKTAGQFTKLRWIMFVRLLDS